jgi:hypothetical protein
MNLCQRETSSCGACCGLYNRRHPGRVAVTAELAHRTDALRAVPRTADGFGAAARALAAEADPPLFSSVRVCPLLGFLDEARTRVGCLGHPAATGGPDLRACGAYDVKTCDTFFCPSFAWLTEEEAEIAERAAGDWHLYGLVVTDVPFLRACLGAVAALAAARVERRHLEAPAFRAALRRLLDLKTQLAPGSKGLFGAFTPAPDGGDAPRRIDYAALGRSASPWDEILTCAGADPRSGNDLDRLEAEVRRRLDACAAAFPAPEAAGRARP